MARPDDLVFVDPTKSCSKKVFALFTWRPDPLSRRFLFGVARLRRKSDVNDTEAITQGTCIAFNANGDGLAAEAILFPDGSTLEFQGIERAGGVPSARTIVGGLGRYLGAIGTMTAAPSADLLLWTQTIEVAAPSDR